MNLCWKLGRATARDVHGQLHRHNWEYRTVKTLLDRIAAKGYLDVEKDGTVRVYTPAVERTRVVGSAIEDFVVNILDNSVGPMLAHLAETRKLTPEDLERLRRLVDDKEGE